MQCAPMDAAGVVSIWRAGFMEPIFLATVFAIIWLSASLFAEDLETLRDTERRLERCPARIR